MDKVPGLSQVQDGLGRKHAHLRRWEIGRTFWSRRNGVVTLEENKKGLRLRAAANPDVRKFQTTS